MNETTRRSVLERGATTGAGLIAGAGIVGAATTAAGQSDDGGSGQTHVVTVGPEGQHVFAPNLLEINRGDTVRFEWDSSFHNIVPTARPEGGSWPGEPLIRLQGNVHEFTFNVLGQYDYLCLPHALFGMNGTINVVEDDV